VCVCVCMCSEMTVPAVIQTLLDKFLITDSCQKFALYEKINYEHPRTTGLNYHQSHVEAVNSNKNNNRGQIGGVAANWG